MKEHAHFFADQILGSRDCQQDAFSLLESSGEGGRLIILCDGMGGQAAGDRASNIAIESFSRGFSQHPSGNIANQLEAGLQLANEALASAIEMDRDLNGMGTTIVAVYLVAEQMHWVSVGDSPLWLVRDGQINRLNADHSLAPVFQKMVEMGEMTAEDAAHDPKRHTLRSSLTGGNIKLVDIREQPFLLKEGDCVLVASDGIETLSENEIVDCCDGISANDTVNNLLQMVHSKGKSNQDNATVCCFYQKPLKKSLGAKHMGKLAGVVVLACFVVLVSLGYLLREPDADANDCENCDQVENVIALKPSNRSGVDSESISVALPNLSLSDNNVISVISPHAVEPVNESTSSKVEPIRPKERSRIVTHTIAGVQFNFVPIPSGTFQMGSSAGDTDAFPVHTVNIPPILILEHEVSYAMWDACVETGGCSYRPEDMGWGREHRPVINVSYNDITQQYIPWLNNATGKTFRFLSEAEWEYAARAGTRTNYFWGDNIGSNQANCNGCGSQWDNEKTAPVKSFASNAFGLYDMHGNVVEWTQDCWNDSYNGAPSDDSAWQAGDCEKRVVRGGSWFAAPASLGSAYRNRFTPSTRGGGLGFRLVQIDE